MMLMNRLNRTISTKTAKSPEAEPFESLNRTALYEHATQNLYNVQNMMLDGNRFLQNVTHAPHTHSQSKYEHTAPATALSSFTSLTLQQRIARIRFHGTTNGRAQTIERIAPQYIAMPLSSLVRDLYRLASKMVPSSRPAPCISKTHAHMEPRYLLTSACENGDRQRFARLNLGLSELESACISAKWGPSAALRATGVEMSQRRMNASCAQIGSRKAETSKDCCRPASLLGGVWQDELEAYPGERSGSRKALARTLSCPGGLDGSPLLPQTLLNSWSSVTSPLSRMGRNVQWMLSRIGA